MNGEVAKGGGAGGLRCVKSGGLRTLVKQTLAREALTRGRVLVRQLVPVRRVSGTLGDFPIGRELRVFLYRDHVVASGFYWEV